MFTCQVQGHSSSLCPQCLPDCELTTYTYTTSSVPFRFLPQKIILTTFGRFDHMYIKSDAATREIWTWVPSVTLAPSPPCWSGNPLWLSKFNHKNLIYDVHRQRKLTNAIVRWCQLIVEPESTHHTQQAYQVPWGGMCSYTSTMNPCIEFVCLIFNVSELFFPIFWESCTRLTGNILDLWLAVRFCPHLQR